MGSWGFRTFEDDTALDEIGGFVSRPSRQRLKKMLDRARSRSGLDDVAASQILVAAELVAALRGHPSDQLPAEASEWLMEHAGSAAPGMGKHAIDAVTAVAERSELKDTWDDAGSLAKWRKSLNELKRRLASPVRPLRLQVPPPSDDDDAHETGLGPTPGATYVMPLEGGFLGACRVVRTAAGDDLLPLMRDLSADKRAERARSFVVVVTSPWVGKSPPPLDDPDLRRVLRLTHLPDSHGAPQIHVAPNEVPPGYTLLGVLPPTPEERQLKGVLSTDWTWEGQQLLQKAWDETHARSESTQPGAGKRAKTAPKKPAKRKSAKKK